MVGRRKNRIQRRKDKRIPRMSTKMKIRDGGVLPIIMERKVCGFSEANTWFEQYKNQKINPEKR